jgi:hypothetical protein
MKAKAHPADLADREGARALLEGVGESFPNPEHLQADAGYRGADLRRWITKRLGSLWRLCNASPDGCGVPTSRALSRGLRSDPQTLDSGAHIRLDLSQPPEESTLRVSARNGRGTDLRDDDPADAQKVDERSRMRASQDIL